MPLPAPTIFVDGVQNTDQSYSKQRRMFHPNPVPQADTELWRDLQALGSQVVSGLVLGSSPIHR